MVSLIVELPEDRAIEVGTVGSEGAIGLTVGLGSRIGSACESSAPARRRRPAKSRPA
jgi:hypothetical protein